MSFKDFWINLLYQGILENYFLQSSICDTYYRSYFPIQLEVNRINSTFRTEKTSDVPISLIDFPFAIFLLMIISPSLSVTAAMFYFQFTNRYAKLTKFTKCIHEMNKNSLLRNLTETHDPQIFKTNNLDELHIIAFITAVICFRELR